MARRKKNKVDLRRLAENLKSLRVQALIKIKGIEAYTGNDGNHYRKYENPENQITPNVTTLTQFAKFYGVTIEDLLEKRNLSLGSELSELEEFRMNYRSFPEYFMDSLSVPDFIRLKLIPLNELKSGLTVSDILKLFPDDPISSKSLSRELSRMVSKGKLEREDPSGKGAVYVYRLPKIREI